MSLRIKEVAEKANVSTATISRVMNDSPLVRPETKEKILKIINELDYHPNVAGLHLRTQKTYSIGIVSPHLGAFHHPYLYHIFGETIRGVALGVRRTQYDIVLARPSMEHGENTDYLRLFKQGKVDGLVVIYPRNDDTCLQQIEKNNWPVALVGAASPKLDYVDVDNRRSVLDIMEMLIHAGHTRIGIINGRNNEDCYRQRFAAYQMGMAASGIPLLPELIFHETTDDKDGYEQMRNMLPGKPTAVFAANDLFAAGAVRAILEAGLRIPDDIALVGFSDTPQATAMQPALTTVRIPLSLMGAKATGMLIRRIENPGLKQQHEVLPGELIRRDSTAGKSSGNTARG